MEERQHGHTVRRRLRRKALQETKPINTLILDFQPPDMGESKSALYVTQSVLVCYGSPH